MPKQRSRRTHLPAVLGVVVALAIAQPCDAITVYRQAPVLHAPPQYFATYGVRPTGINDLGQVTGVWNGLYGTYPGVGHDVRSFFTTNAVSVDLGIDGAAAINGAGVVVGGSSQAFSWANGAVTHLGTLGGTKSYATGINAGGQIVGASQVTGNVAYHAFLYSGGAMQDLGTLGGTNSYATGINASGQVVGYSQIAGDAATRGFLYSGGVMADLGTLGGANSRADAINSTGDVAGSSDFGDGTVHAFLRSGAVMQDLGLPTGAMSATVAPGGLNDGGTVVGTVMYQNSLGGYTAFVHDGTMRPLPASVASGINGAGQIIASTFVPCAPTGSCATGFRLDPTVTLPPRSDADGDGRADIFFRNGVTGDVNVWLLSAQPAIRSDSGNVGNVADADWVILGTGDFDGDGKADLLWRNVVTGEVSLWFIDGTAMKPSSNIVTTIDPAAWQYAGTGDFDQDGVSDVVWRNGVTGDVYVWLMNGRTIKPGSGFVGNAPPGTWTILGVGDFDGDLKSDLLWQNAVTGDINVWFLDGTSIRPQSGNVSALAPASWAFAGASDFDGDFKDDIVWRNAATNELYIWYMSGLAWKAASGYAATVVPADWTIVGAASRGTLLWRNSVHDVGQGTLAPSTAFSVSEIANVGSSAWQSVAP